MNLRLTGNNNSLIGVVVFFLVMCFVLLNIEDSKSIVCDKSNNICYVKTVRNIDKLAMLFGINLEKEDSFLISDVQNGRCHKFNKKTSSRKSYKKRTKIRYNAYLVLKDKEIKIKTCSSSIECQDIVKNLVYNIKKYPMEGTHIVYQSERH